MDKRVHLKFNLLNKSYSSGIVKDCENIYENECVSTIILSPFTAMLQRMPGSGPNANLRKSLIVSLHQSKIYPKDTQPSRKALTAPTDLHGKDASIFARGGSHLHDFHCHSCSERSFLHTPDPPRSSTAPPIRPRGHRRGWNKL
jgi:hypothetical protein